MNTLGYENNFVSSCSLKINLNVQYESFRPLTTFIKNPIQWDLVHFHGCRKMVTDNPRINHITAELGFFSEKMSAILNS